MTTHPLTKRQIEACAYYAQGLRADEIAKRMGIGKGTVNSHVEDARLRMKARTAKQLMFMLGREVRDA